MPHSQEFLNDRLNNISDSDFSDALSTTWEQQVDVSLAAAIENIYALLLAGAKLQRRLGDRRHTRTGGMNEINRELNPQKFKRAGGRRAGLPQALPAEGPLDLRDGDGAVDDVPPPLHLVRDRGGRRRAKHGECVRARSRARRWEIV